MPIGLIKLISTQKVLKSAINRAQNSTNWALITPLNRNITSPLAMTERKREQTNYVHKKMVFQKERN